MPIIPDIPSPSDFGAFLRTTSTPPTSSLGTQRNPTSLPVSSIWPHSHRMPRDPAIGNSTHSGRVNKRKRATQPKYMETWLARIGRGNEPTAAQLKEAANHMKKSVEWVEVSVHSSRFHFRIRADPISELAGEGTSTTAGLCIHE